MIQATVNSDGQRGFETEPPHDAWLCRLLEEEATLEQLVQQREASLEDAVADLEWTRYKIGCYIDNGEKV
mgnify:CR=1 FL=1